MDSRNEKKVILKEIPEPERDCSLVPHSLSDQTIQMRKQKVLQQMHIRNLDTLVVYGDLEHGGNFEYLTGFLPRFEEALLVLHADGRAYLLLGNENLNKCGKSRIAAEPVLCSYFSLPDQPMQSSRNLEEILAETELHGRVGVAGWKKLPEGMYDLPAYLLTALEHLCGKENLCNAIGLFLGADGVRVTNCADEIAHYEFYASLAGDAMLDAMDALRPGVSEMEIGTKLNRLGQDHNIVTIASFGERFIRANMYPSDHRLSAGEPISLTAGFRCGCSSRASAAVSSRNELPEGQKDYFEKLCVPYFRAIAVWLERIHAGMSGGDLYELMEQVLPKEKYHWKLNPGHLTAEEEWLCSPVYKNSQELLRSGMILQTDVIPSLPGYPGISAESTCVLADQNLREEITREFPDLYARMMNRRRYMKEVQGISLNEDVLPMCSSLAYMRPYALSHQAAVIEE
ncbi:MAG: M24 family metallopeptidase [Bulleidia sp.]